MNNTCQRCRHHSKTLRPRPQQPVVSAGMDYCGIAFSDVDEPFYICRAPAGADAPWAGREVGFEPVTCEAFMEGVRLDAKQASTLDEAVARMAARQAARTPRDDER